jgi:integrase
MPRRIRSSTLETRTARLKLAQHRKPYWIAVAPGISLGYRRNAGPGAWNVRAADGKGGNWIKSFGIADDREDADGANVLTFWQAADKAKALARGQDSDAGRPATVSEALADYETDLGVRGAGADNSTRLQNRLPPSLLSKPVSMLAVKELRAWRNGLTEVMKASSVNRLCKGLKAALNLAAEHDDRILNSKAWRTGLALLPEADDTESNLVLSDGQRRAVIVSAYAISAEFGLYVEVHAATGARTSQIALLDVGDLHAGKEPKLMVPSSLKGKSRRTRTRKPMPITIGLAQRLKAAAARRDAAEPLLLNSAGGRWSARAHRRLFIEAAKAARLPDGATMYCLRHTAITRALLAGVPVRLVASSFDTSVAMIEKTYSKFIADHGDAQMRRALFDIDAPADGNVVALVR